jgi:hypothetical protein
MSRRADRHVQVAIDNQVQGHVKRAIALDQASFDGVRVGKSQENAKLPVFLGV